MQQTVLLVDDDRNLLRGMARALHNQPYTLITAENAQEATFLFKTHPIDLVVTDEHMPGLRGTALLEWVSECFPRTVRIVLTGQPDVPMALRAINAGKVFRFLTKPCKEFELAVAIREGLELQACYAKQPEQV